MDFGISDDECGGVSVGEDEGLGGDVAGGVHAEATVGDAGFGEVDAAGVGVGIYLFGGGCGCSGYVGDECPCQCG